MDIYGKYGTVLGKLINDILNIEEKVNITGEFKDISNNDMHVIEAIGIDKPKNMSTVAKALSVTVGTLTIAINNLVKKDYVERVRSQQDRRVVFISLTTKGKRAYEKQLSFREEIIKATVSGLKESEVDTLIKALNNLVRYINRYSV